ncbi:MAG: DUF1611 domain-containing protein [Microcystaceae cyanobacterium]
MSKNPCLTPNHRVAILLHQGILGHHGKTGLAYLRYGEGEIVAIIDEQCAGQSLEKVAKIPKDIPIVAHLQDALTYQPDVLLIGIAPSGGALPDTWQQEIDGAVKAGLSIVNGLHTPLSSRYSTLATNQWIWDVRHEIPTVGIATGKARTFSCQRILAVGTDMSVGKMSTCLEFHRSAHEKGIKSKFLGTGQGGIMISGVGIPLDAIRVDFAAGAVEDLVLRYGKDYEMVWIEGQGSLLHPGSTATLPLIRGSQPTDLILVHRAGQRHIHGLSEFIIPPLTDVINLYETVAKVGNTLGDVKVKGIALNTFHLDENEAQAAIEAVISDTGLPCTDVVRYGANKLLAEVRQK